jgi:imidazoleglycerol-phosphate dehydratase
MHCAVRNFTYERKTAETVVQSSLTLDAAEPPAIATGYRMLDHLLQQFAFHAPAGLRLSAQSLDGIEHHLVEDVAIALGESLRGALADGRGIERFGAALLPMDDALVRVAVDLGGRGYARVDLGLTCERIEDLTVEMVPHFFASFAVHAGIALHVDRLAGTNAHHCVEAAFKALARACGDGWRLREFAARRASSTKDVVA